MDKHLHVISFDVPYPPNYGGVIDVFYKIRALHEKGVKVHLHCFQYGREAAAELSAITHRVSYYPRNVAKSQLFVKLPYIVVSRYSEEMMNHLLSDDHPIIFEGLHTCSILADDRMNNRMKVVRTHNVEHDYYKSLAEVESNIFKRYYFYNEAAKLEAFEPVLKSAHLIAAISRNDTAHYEERFGNAFYIPAFHNNESVNIKTGRGNFAVYHGNLAIGENNEAALYLVNEVFNRINTPLIIAGSRPSRELKNAVAKRNNVTLLADLTTRQIHQLIHDAQVNVMPTFQPTGIKLKLLSALYNGRFAVVNPMMVENTGLETLCDVGSTPEELCSLIERRMEEDFRESDIRMREKTLGEQFSNAVNAQKLMDLIYKS